MVAAKHRVAALDKAALVREPQQQRQGVPRQAVLGIVEMQTNRIHRKPLGALRVVGKQLAQVDVAYLRVVFL
jgi:hypothetical protein